MSVSTGKWTTTVIIDGEKLQYEITKRGLRNGEVSLALGHADNYIKGCMTSGKIPKSMILMLGTMFNIKEEDILPDKAESTPETVEQVVPTIVTEKVDIQPIINDLLEVMARQDKFEQLFLQRMDELIATINRIGNVEMQSMEYLKELKDLMK